jgi:two-component system sensor histidine kinase RegB
LRIRTLVTVRWMAVAGQLGTILFVAYGLGFPMPTLACLGLVALSAALNLTILLAGPVQRQASDREATAQLAFDLLQLSALLYLTGGAVNPFSVLLIAPVVLAAATLPLRQVVALGLLAVAGVVLLSITALPLPAPHADPFDPPLVNRVGGVLSRVLGIVFCAGTGGHEAYHGKDMLATHKGMNINEQEFMTVIDDAMDALQKNGIDDATRNEVLAILWSMRREVLRV